MSSVVPRGTGQTGFEPQTPGLQLMLVCNTGYKSTNHFCIIHFVPVINNRNKDICSVIVAGFDGGVNGLV